MDRQPLGSVEKALRILKAFSVDCSCFTLTQLSNETGFNKSTLLRLLRLLEQEGFIARDNKQYHLGLSVGYLGKLANQTMGWSNYIQPVLKELQEYSGKSAAFMIRQEEREVCAFFENSTDSLHHHLKKGDSFVIPNGITGELFPALDTQGSHVAHQKLRTQKYTYTRGGRDENLAAVAVAVLQQSKCIGALTLSGVANAFTPRVQEQCLSALKQKALLLQRFL